MAIKQYFQKALDTLSQNTGVGIKSLDDIAGYSDKLSKRSAKKIRNLKPGTNWGEKDIAAAIKLGKAKSVIPAGILAGGAAVMANDTTRDSVVGTVRSALDKILGRDKNK